MAFIFSHTLNSTGAQAIFALMQLLLTQGWTKTQDSDGTTYSPTGNRITHAGVGANGLANNFAWFVMKMPNSNRSICFQRSNTNNQSWRFSYCANNNFTAGTPGATQIPAPAAGSIEVIIIGGGTPAAPTFGTTWLTADGGYTAHAEAGGSSEGFCFILFATNNGTNANASGLFLDKIITFQNDLDPYLVGATLTASPSFSTFVGNTDGGLGAAKAFIGPLNVAANVKNFSLRTAGMDEFNIGTSGWNGKDMMIPPFWTSNTGPGVKGFSTLFKFSSVTNRTQMTTYNVLSPRDYLYLVAANLPTVVPWDGSNPGIANFDAEIIGNQLFDTIRYVMQATCTSSPTGYITWENNTGDDTNRPACGGIGGPSKIISSWPIS